MKLYPVILPSGAAIGEFKRGHEVGDSNLHPAQLGGRLYPLSVGKLLTP